MSDATTLRRMANDLRREADRRDQERTAQSCRVVTAMVGLTALRSLIKERP